MNRLLLLLLISGALILGSAKADQIQTDQDRCIELTKEIFARLNDLATKNQIPSINFEPDHVTVKTEYDHYWKLNLWQVRTLPYATVQYLPQSHMAVYFDRDTYKNAPLYDNPPKPTWTESQAIENAKQWVNAVLTYFPKNVATPRIVFRDQRNVPKYYDGHWKIRWARTDSQGHSFDGDALTVEISEKYGLMSMGLTFHSIFDDTTSKTISQEEAVRASRSSAEDLLHGELARPYLAPGSKLGNPSTSMWIMNPNHMLKSNSLEDAGKYDQVARLAWVVAYPLINSAPSAHDQMLEIWIDARTKEIIGGDFH